MKIGAHVLRELRGPLMAATLVAGCASASPEAPAPSLEPTPAPEPVVAAAAVDPVSYDAEAEAARLERLDRSLAAAQARRDRRVDAEREARRPVRQVPQRPPDYMLMACGRG